MIVNEHIAAYLDSLATTLPESLEQLEVCTGTFKLSINFKKT